MMEHYSFLRGMADSWGLLAMMLFFIGAIAILFRPGARAMHEDAASIPLRDDAIDRRVGDPETATNKDNSLESEGAK
jgi:cytochrome c oxidase cbb3-type subunit 4